MELIFYSSLEIPNVMKALPSKYCDPVILSTMHRIQLALFVLLKYIVEVHFPNAF